MAAGSLAPPSAAGFVQERCRGYSRSQQKGEDVERRTGTLRTLVSGSAGVVFGFLAGRAFQEAMGRPPGPPAAEPAPLPTSLTGAGFPEEMPPWITTLLRRIVLWILGLLLAAWVLRSVRSFLFTLFLAFFLSLALEPAVKWLHTKGWKRGLATGAVMGSLGLVGLLVLAVMVPSVIRQLAGLVEQLPHWLDQLDTWVGKRFGVDMSIEAITEQLKRADASLTGVATNVFGNILGVGSAILGGIFRLMTVGLFTFYFVADGPRFRRSVCSVLPTHQQELVLKAWEVAIEKTGGYLYSRLLLAMVSGAGTWVVLMILHVPFAGPLAIWVGIISQFIPTFGTYIAMSVPLTVALFEDPTDAVILLVYFTAYQQVENYILSPRITAKTMQLHPAVAFGSAMVGASLAGPIGAFLALPVVATIQSGVLVYIVERHEVVSSALTEEEEPHPQVKPVEEVGLLDDVRARWWHLRRR